MSDPWSVFDGTPIAATGAPVTGSAPAVSAAPKADDGWDAFNGVAPAALAAAVTDSPGASAATAAPASEPTQSFGHKFGLGVRDMIEGTIGLPYDAIAKGARSIGIPVNPIGQNLDALGFPQAETSEERLSSAIIQPVASTLTMQGAGRALAGAVSPVVQAVGQTLQAQPVTQAVSAGVGGATTDLTGSPTAGLIAGLATPLAGAALGRAISPNILENIGPQRAAAIATAEANDIPMSLAQMTGGKVARNFESSLANLPGSSARQAAFNDAQSEAFNRATMARTGTPSTTALPDDLNAARANLGAQFDQLSARNTLQHDPQSAGELTQLVQNVQRYAPADVQRTVMARIEDAVNLAPNGQMPGQAYRQNDSALGAAIRGASSGDVRTYLGDLQTTLRNAMDRSISPEDQQQWQDVRGQYANLMTVAKAMNRPSEGTALGNVSPAALAQASNNTQTKRFAFGRGNFDDLSRLGQVALKQTVPDSGTAQRTLMANALSGGNLGAMAAGAGGLLASGQNPLFALAAPAISVGLPRVAAGLYHSNALANYLTNDLVSGLTPQPNALLSATIGGEQQAQRLRGP